MSLCHSCFAATRGGRELDWNAPSLELDPNMFHSSLRRTTSDQDCNGWSDPGGKGFMVRSQTYNENSLKVCITLFVFSLYQDFQYPQDMVDLTWTLISYIIEHSE